MLITRIPFMDLMVPFVIRVERMDFKFFVTEKQAHSRAKNDVSEVVIGFSLGASGVAGETTSVLEELSLSTDMGGVEYISSVDSFLSNPSL